MQRTPDVGPLSGARTLQNPANSPSKWHQDSSMPVGFKNGDQRGFESSRSRNWKSVRQPGSQTFLGITEDGNACRQSQLGGNPDCQLISSGGSNGPNIGSSIECGSGEGGIGDSTSTQLDNDRLKPRNTCGGDPSRQPEVRSLMVLRATCSGGQ